jgi:hypothetical protein
MRSGEASRPAPAGSLASPPSRGHEVRPRTNPVSPTGSGAGPAHTELLDHACDRREALGSSPRPANRMQENDLLKPFWPKRNFWGGSRTAIREAAHHVATPFMGFVLSDYYLSEEIDELGLGFLNPRSRRLNHRIATRIRPSSSVYCQVDQLDEFADRHLPRLRGPFVLITGKWHLPALDMSPACQAILASPLLLAWYSQNQVYDVPIRPFPYGVHLATAPAVVERIRNPQVKERRVFVPFATMHPHLTGIARTTRVALQSYMSPALPLTEYLDAIASSSFVISPPGDRPDTYRHWEAIALGAVPVSILAYSFRDLFDDALLFSDDLTLQAHGVIDESAAQPNPALATVQHWRALVSASRLAVE